MIIIIIIINNIIIIVNIIIFVNQYIVILYQLFMYFVSFNLSFLCNVTYRFLNFNFSINYKIIFCITKIINDKNYQYYLINPLFFESFSLCLTINIISKNKSECQMSQI